MYKRKNFLKKALAIFCVGILIPFSAAAEEKTVSSECDISDIDVPIAVSSEVTEIGQTLDIKAKSAILLEPHTGQILYEMNADEVLPPASITKIMSLLLVCEAIDRGDLALEDTVYASEHASRMGGSQIWLEPGEGMSVDHLLKAAVVASANDATVALGEAVAGSEEAFVALMNKRADELGMGSSVFVNCTGLDAEGHVTTAHDVALMSAALIKHELIKNYSTVWMDTIRDGKSELINTNKLVRFYKGTTGLKTGTTSGAGYCLSATAERDGMELVAVIMSGESSPLRFEGAKKLLDYGFSNYSFKSISADIEKGYTESVEKGVEKSVEIVAEDTLKILLKKSDGGEITQKVTLNSPLTAPISKGQTLGEAEVFLGETSLGKIPLVSAEKIEKKTVKTVFLWIASALFTP